MLNWILVLFMCSGGVCKQYDSGSVPVYFNSEEECGKFAKDAAEFAYPGTHLACRIDSETI